MGCHALLQGILSIQGLKRKASVEVVPGTSVSPLVRSVYRGPGKFHGQMSLAGYSPWGRKESDMTERLSLSQSLQVAGPGLHHIIANVRGSGLNPSSTNTHLEEFLNFSKLHLENCVNTIKDIEFLRNHTRCLLHTHSVHVWSNSDHHHGHLQPEIYNALQAILKYMGHYTFAKTHRTERTLPGGNLLPPADTA